MGRHSCCYTQKLRKGLWSPEEDEKLLRHITKFGHGCWSSVPKQAGLQRCGKSCRLRWINYLRPDLKRGTFSEDEENLIIDLHKALGNRWSQIAAQLPGRTDNEIKNLWNSCLKKKLKQRGIDPATHKQVSESEAENGGEATNVHNTNISVDSDSGLSNELKLIKVHNSSTCVLSHRPTLVSSMAENSNSNIFNSNRSFFMDRYENPQNEGSQHSDLMGLWNNPIQQWSYGTTPNPKPAFLFTQQQNTKNYNSISTDLPLTSVAATDKSSSSTTTFQSQNSSFDVNGNRYWEMGVSNNSSTSTTTNAELHSNNSVFAGAESNMFMDSIQEDIKWPEILRNPFLMAATLQYQTPQPFYNEIKSETQFDAHNSLTMSIWSNNQQMQESSQAEFVHF